MWLHDCTWAFLDIITVGLLYTKQSVQSISNKYIFMPQDIFILKLQNSKKQKQFMIFLILSSLICVCSYLPTLMICMMLKDRPFCIQVRFHREVLIHEQDCLLSYENMCFLMTNLKSSWMDVLPKRPKWTKKNFINQDKRNDVYQ